MKPLLLLLLLLFTAAVAYLLRPSKTATLFNQSAVPVSIIKENASLPKLKSKVATCKLLLECSGFSTCYVFLIDMSLPSGRNRFFLYDLRKDAVIHSGLVAHGSCNTKYLARPRFSNVPECGCSAEGRYKVSGAYEGKFGTAYKLFGLDSTNSNAYKRYIVLHGYDCVPDEEADPYPICNSLGCPMVSYKFLKRITGVIEHSDKPVLLWIFN